MIINTLQEFYKFFQPNRPILSIDYGQKKIGLGISSPDHHLPMPLKIINGKSDKQKLQKIISIILEKNICAIVIGLPINMDGTKSEQTFIVEKFANQLQISSELPIFMQDERLTSKLASNLLKEIGLKRKERDSKDDLIAACMILETTLESCKKISK